MSLRIKGNITIDRGNKNESSTCDSLIHLSSSTDAVFTVIADLYFMSST